MRRFAPFLVLAASLPLMTAAAVPASRVKEPNAVFAYHIDYEHDRVAAVLFDRANKTALAHLDATFDYFFSDTLEFSPATKKIYGPVSNFSDYGGYGRVRADRPYDAAIVETDFDGKKPSVVFSCDACAIREWIVHPSKPTLYVSLDDWDAERDPGEFKRAKLVEVTLGPKPRTRVLGRIPSGSPLFVTPDGGKVFTFKEGYGTKQRYGALVSIDLSNRRRTQTIVNFPETNGAFGPHILESNVSPDGLEFAYFMGIVDVRTGKVDPIADDMPELPYEVDNVRIGWSRASDKLLYQFRNVGAQPGHDQTPLLFDTKTRKEWILPVTDYYFIAWAPAQTAMLFSKRNGAIGFYDLEKREWTHVFDAGPSSGASWVTLPTKKVPKR